MAGKFTLDRGEMRCTCHYYIDEKRVVLLIERIIATCPLSLGAIGTELVKTTKYFGFPRYFKRYFGGLRKFIICNSENFTLGHDHPFNPKVFLRRVVRTPKINTFQIIAPLRREITTVEHNLFYFASPKGYDFASMWRFDIYQ